MANKKLQGGGKLTPHTKRKITYDPGAPLTSVVAVDPNQSEYSQLLSANAARDELNRYKWANFQGNWVDFPAGKGVPQFNATPEALAERGLTMDYINTYQPSNYQTTLTPEQTAQKWFTGPPEPPQLGLGDFIRNNTQGIIGGLKTLAGAGAMFIPGLQGLGVGLMGSGIGDIGKEVVGDRQQAALDKQQAQVDEENKLASLQQTKSEQMQSIASGNSNFVQPPQMQYGGPINYTGQTHLGPQGGIPVDAQGNPAVVTKQRPVAMTEAGEVAWRTPSGERYVFSKELGTAKEANKVFKRAEMRLGKNYNNPDQISKQGMERSLMNLIAKNEQLKCGGKIKRMKGGGEMPKFQGGGFDFGTGVTTETYTPYVGTSTVYSPTANSNVSAATTAVDPYAGMSPWSPFPTQALGIGIQAGLGTLGNVLMAKNLPKPEQITAPKVGAPKINLAEQRIQAEVDAAQARGRARAGARRAGLSKAQEQAVLGTTGAKIMGEAGRVKMQSRLQEQTANVTAQQQADARNQQAEARVRQLNALRGDQYIRDKYGLYGQAVGSLAQGVGDLTRAYQDSQYLNVLGSRAGYQMVKDADGNVRMVPMEGFWG